MPLWQWIGLGILAIPTLALAFFAILFVITTITGLCELVWDRVSGKRKYG